MGERGDVELESPLTFPKATRKRGLFLCGVRRHVAAFLGATCRAVSKRGHVRALQRAHFNPFRDLCKSFLNKGGGEAI